MRVASRVREGDMGTPIETPKESFSTWLGRWFARQMSTNNARARVLLIFMFVLTLASVITVAALVITHDSPPIQANDPIPSMDRSVIHTGYLPDAEKFFGYAQAKQDSADTQDVANRQTSWGWIIFWLVWWFVALPLGWLITLAYGLISLREESWEFIQNMFASIREGISNFAERGKTEGKESSGTTSVINWPAPTFVVAGSGGQTAAATEAEKPIPWIKFLKFIKKNAGEIIASLFVIDEIFELRKSKKGQA
ncbi:hypothetical protein C4546_04360 [Candidatus Parcubacteria bacterium]|nr:MAG: hypothetical protein C4546_04360 [Candidatus Parcubacteria bacterium]